MELLHQENSESSALITSSLSGGVLQDWYIKALSGGMGVLKDVFCMDVWVCVRVNRQVDRCLSVYVCTCLSTACYECMNSGMCVYLLWVQDASDCPCVLIIVSYLESKAFIFWQEENSNNPLCTGTFAFGLVVYQDYTVETCEISSPSLKLYNTECDDNDCCPENPLNPPYLGLFFSL